VPGGESAVTGAGGQRTSTRNHGQHPPHALLKLSGHGLMLGHETLDEPFAAASVRLLIAGLRNG
jgi:hypothetical protein